MADVQRPTVKATTITENSEKTLSKVVSIDERRIRDYRRNLVHGTVEETLYGMGDVEGYGHLATHAFGVAVTRRQACDYWTG